MKVERFLIISKKEKDGFFEYGIKNQKRKAFLINHPNDYNVGSYVFVEYLYKEGMYLNLKIL